MPDAVAFGFDLLRSQRERRLRWLAGALSAGSALACCAAAIVAPGPLRILAAVATVAIGVFTLRPRRSATPAARIAVDAAGAIRVVSGGQSATATVRYCAPGYICLKLPEGVLPLWSDTLPAEAWRRLLVACRWPHRADADGGRRRSN